MFALEQHKTLATSIDSNVKEHAEPGALGKQDEPVRASWGKAALPDNSLPAWNTVRILKLMRPQV